MKDDFEIPEGLSERGRLAAELIVKRVRAVFGRSSCGGGCRAFYTPEEWADREEEYGCNSLLIVVHDGGDMVPLFSPYYGNGSVSAEMYEDLKKVGLYSEACTGWYSAIYEV